jgi:hypothetical protein
MRGRDTFVGHTRSEVEGSEEQGSEGGGSGDEIKCPVCRKEFLRQKIRALYSYV